MDKTEQIKAYQSSVREQKREIYDELIDLAWKDYDIDTELLVDMLVQIDEISELVRLLTWQHSK